MDNRDTTTACFFRDCNDRRPISTAPSTAPAAMSASVTINAQKSKHQLHEDDSDDATTAYSSWIEDNSSQLSFSLSGRSSHDDDDDDDDDDSQLSCPQTIISLPSTSLRSTRVTEEDEIDNADEDDTPLLRHLSYSSSFYSAVTSQHNEPTDNEFSNSSSRGEFHFELHPVLVDAQENHLRHERRSRKSDSVSAASSSFVENEALFELAERAQHMLLREQSVDYKIDDYFHRGNDAASLGVSTSHSPIDASCRSKMMEWSFRVLEFSFPYPSSQQQTSDQKDVQPRRKYSTQAIQIVSQAFNLIDRLATRHFHQNANHAMDRSQYKLICMGCLHLAAKTSGLFGLYDTDDEYAMEEECSPSSQDEYQEKDASNPSRQGQQEEENDSCCYYLSQNSTSSLSLSSLASHGPCSSDCNEGQTVISTPVLSRCSGDGSVCQGQLSDDPLKSISIDNNEAHQDARQNKSHSTSQRTSCVRPPLNILSLTGISSLSQNEYSLKQLVDMEMKILAMLDWKLMSVTSVDWCHLLLDFCANVYDYSGGNGNRKGMRHVNLEKVRERTLTNLECAMETSLCFAPSLVALAAVVHALDEYHVHEREMQRIISMHKNIVLDLLPYGAEEVNEVRSCF